MPRDPGHEEAQEAQADGDVSVDNSRRQNDVGSRLIKYSKQKTVAKWLKNHTLSLMTQNGFTPSRDLVKVNLCNGRLKVSIHTPDGKVLA